MTQAQMAAKLGMTQANYSRIESGRQHISTKFLEKFERLYKHFEGRSIYDHDARENSYAGGEHETLAALRRPTAEGGFEVTKGAILELWEVDKTFEEAVQLLYKIWTFRDGRGLSSACLPMLRELGMMIRRLERY